MTIKDFNKLHTLKVIIVSNPILHPLSVPSTANNNYYCLARDFKGFQVEVDLQALPAGVALNQIEPNQVWWVDKRTNLYRLTAFGGTYDPTTKQVTSTSYLPVDPNSPFLTVSGGTISGNLTIASGLTVSGNFNINGNTISGGVTTSGYVLTATSSSGSRFTAPVTSTYSEGYITINATLGAGGATNINSLALAAGTWLITARATFGLSSGSASCDFAISPTSASFTSAYAGVSCAVTAAQPAPSFISFTKTVVLASSTTVYFIAQPSTSTGTAYAVTTVKSVPNATGLTAVKIA